MKAVVYAPVAQLDRASGYGPEGHGFESSSARQNKENQFARIGSLYFCL